MTDNVENLVLEHLRHIRGKVDHISDDVLDLKSRMSSLESSIVSIKYELAHGDETDSRQQMTLDRLVERLHRIETRLNLISNAV